MKKKIRILMLLALFIAAFLFFYRPDIFFSTRNEKAVNDIRLSSLNPDNSNYCFAYASDCRENMGVLAKVVENVNNDPAIQWLIFGGDIVYNSDLYEYKRFLKVAD